MPPSRGRWAGPTACSSGFGWRGGLGIVFDDLVAAFCTLLVLALGVRFAWTPG